MQKIDYVLDRITMYRLVLYILIALVCIACILGYFSLVPASPKYIVISAVALIAVGWIANFIFSWAYDAPTNIESVYITALILTLIMSPALSLSGLIVVCWAVVLAMLSKFALAINKKHIFNPAAIGVVITGLVLGEPASWWVGTAWMAPFIALSGLLIIRKLRFYDLAWGFFMVTIVAALVIGALKGSSLQSSLTRVVMDSYMLFLGSIMVTEPLTMPPIKKLQMLYGGLVGFLAIPQVSILGFTFSPEMALCVGNIFAFLVSPKYKLVLMLTDRIQVAKGAMDFVFRPSQKISYMPGQYMEWTLSHPHFDSRGNRRYFTLASSPTEETIRLGVKFSENGSSYKRALTTLDNYTPIVAAQLSGEFTLPKNPKQKLAFFAGGIGITPFRSMIKYLLDINESRDIVLCYANKTEDEIAYRDIFDDAQKRFGTKVIYTLTDKQSIPANWSGAVGRIDEEMIKREIPDYKERLFYLSGPQTMVNSYEKVLKHMKVPHKNIKKDFFPGLA